MPWKPSDASKHKKGLTESQKKQWAKIANEALKQCQDKGNKDCEGYAIRVANSKVGNKKNSEEDASMNKKVLRMPKGGYTFTSDEPILEFKDKDEDGKPKTFSMEAYTGGIMPDIFGGSIAVDITGVNFQGKKRFPILEQHDWDKKIGVANSVPATENNKIFFDKINILSNDTAQEFSSNMADGFPYQASISVKPLKIEEVPEGESADVNGTKLKGPGIVIRTSNFREASVCVFGRDSNTKVAALSDTEGNFDDVEVEVVNFTENNNVASSDKNDDGGQNMDWDQIKKDYPELYKKFKEAWDEKDSQITEKDQQIASLTQERDDLKQKVDNFSDQEKKYEQRIAALEKADQIRKEKEISDNASNIADVQLKASEVPVRLYDKVKKQVNHNDYVDENGVFDAQKFTEAVKAEIKEWSDAINASATNTPIMGASGGGGNDIDMDQQYEDLAKTMLKFAGVEEETKQQ